MSKKEELRINVMGRLMAENRLLRGELTDATNRAEKLELSLALALSRLSPIERWLMGSTEDKTSISPAITSSLKS